MDVSKHVTAEVQYAYLEHLCTQLETREYKQLLEMHQFEAASEDGDGYLCRQDTPIRMHAKNVCMHTQIHMYVRLCMHIHQREQKSIFLPFVLFLSLSLSQHHFVTHDKALLPNRKNEDSVLQ